MIIIKGHSYDYLFTIKCDNESDFMYKQKLLIEKGFLTFNRDTHPITYRTAGATYRTKIEQDINKPIFLNVWSDMLMTYEVDLSELLIQINETFPVVDLENFELDSLTIIYKEDEMLKEVNSYLEAKKMNLF